jgi:hypothetical protein
MLERGMLIGYDRPANVLRFLACLRMPAGAIAAVAICQEELLDDLRRLTDKLGAQSYGTRME